MEIWVLKHLFQERIKKLLLVMIYKIIFFFSAIVGIARGIEPEANGLLVRRLTY